MAKESSGKQKPYDLEERTAKFGEAIIAFAKSLPQTPITLPLIGQLTRSGTSVGANYCEADEGGTKKEFRHFISICKREARESKHWLRMIAAAVPDRKADAVTHWKEARELHLIFAAIHRNSKT